MAVKCGVPIDIFWKLNPIKLIRYSTFFEQNYKNRQKEIDLLAWRIGLYTIPGVDHVLDSKNKYPDMPYMLDESAQKNSELTEEEISRQREAFLSSLMIMQANFNLNRSNET